MATLTTAQKIAALETIKASGALQTRFADGSAVTYRSMAELDKALADLKATQASEVSTPRLRRLLPGVTNGIAS